jgi:hypothetical protein
MDQPPCPATDPQLPHKVVHASTSDILPHTFFKSFNCSVLRNVSSDNLVVKSALDWLICATRE